MDEINIETATAALYVISVVNHCSNIVEERLIRKKWRRRRWWMLSVHRNRTRQSMENQLAELLREPSGELNNFLRMSLEDFEFLINKISPLIVKKDTKWRDAIPVKIRLAITLWFLAPGDSFRSLHYTFKVSSQSISKIVPEVCLALNEVLKYSIKVCKGE